MTTRSAAGEGTSPALVRAVRAGTLDLAVVTSRPPHGHLDREPVARRRPLLGVWPGLTGRPHVAHHAGVWLTKLRLVQAGCGITTVPANLLNALPDGVVAVPVAGLPPERRRLVLARWPGRQQPAARAVADVVRAVVVQNSSSKPT